MRDGWPGLSGRPREARVKGHVNRDGVSSSVRSCRVGCAVTHTIAGRSCGDDGVRELEGEKILRWYVRDAETKPDHTGTMPSDEKVRRIAAYARVASADRAGRAIDLTRPAYTRGLQSTVCLHRVTSAVYTYIRA